MLSASDLASMRADAVQGLTASCTIEALNKTGDSAGGRTYGTPSTSSPVACRVEMAGGDNLPIIANGLSSRRYVYIVLPWDTTVKTENVIIIGSKRYTVFDVPDRTFSILLRVLAWEAVAA